MIGRYSRLLALCAIVYCSTAFAQMEKGDKEIGIGGQVLFTHTSNFTGTADGQFALGYYASVKNYFGFEADPTFTFEHSGGHNSTNIGGFFGGNYRRLIGNPKGKVFPFLGGGGGGYVTGGSGGNSAAAALYGEFGLKSFLSQKTSLEFAYKLLYTPQGGGGFQGDTVSLMTISLRHVF